MGLFGNSDSEVVKQDDELSGSIAIESSNGNDSEKLILSRVAGSWLKGVDFTDTDTKKTQRYWLREKTQITKLDNTVPENPLPTDARIRKDLLALKDGNFDLAQEHKEAIEVVCVTNVFVDEGNQFRIFVNKSQQNNKNRNNAESQN